LVTIILGSLYNSSYSLETISKKEFRATKYAFKMLVPLQTLKELYRKGIDNIYDIADILDVEPTLIEKAYNYYLQNCLLKTNTF